MNSAIVKSELHKVSQGRGVSRRDPAFGRRLLFFILDLRVVVASTAIITVLAATQYQVRGLSQNNNCRFFVSHFTPPVFSRPCVRTG